VVSFTINEIAWLAEYPPPYVIALVEIEEQPGVRLTTNILDCEPETVYIGMPVMVYFEHCGDVWVPLFRPVATNS
jgi:uncharacterized OB-fold protein